MYPVKVACVYVWLCASSQLAASYVVSGQYWAEDDSPLFPSESRSRMSRQTALERLQAVKRVMEEQGVNAYVVPTADAHNSQYIAPSDARREWLSGLTGSSGTAVVTSSHALVWTDGRYFTQFYLQVDTDVWSLMRQGTDPDIPTWLAANMTSGSVVGVDPTTYTRTAWRTLENTLSQAGVSLRAVSENLVDLARTRIGDPPPPRPNKALLPLTVDFTGRRSDSKIADLMDQITARKASALVITALDDIAYTLNLRGSDIPYNPVFFAYLVLIPHQNIFNEVVLFWGNGTLSPDIHHHLATEGTAVIAKPYGEIFDYLRNMTVELEVGSTIWLSQDGSHAIHQAAEADGAVNIMSTVSPVALMKCVKNDVELKGFRSAHVKDGVAVVRFLRWIHEAVAGGDNVTEIGVTEKLLELRRQERFFVGPSFPTIAGAGENGAIIHYKPSPDGEQRVIRADDILLVDSGAQYMDGTTDITRTRHMSSSPTPEQRLTFTRVLKGQILLGTAVFPKGTTGNVLETLARKALWDVGLNYAHGTGHGVGHYLNVHEGPSGIGAVRMASDPGIVPGMIFSDEPGYYEVGEYGIRHEDLVEVIDINENSDHIYAKGMVGDFGGVGAVGFHTISLAPHQTACLDVSILDDHEIKYINDYHARVLATLGPILQSRNLTEDYEFLVKECAPISRSGAILIKSTSSLLAAVGFISLWLST